MIGTSFGIKLFNVQPMKLIYRFVPRTVSGATGKDIGMVGFIDDNTIAFSG